MINADKQVRSTRDDDKWLYKELTHKIIGCCYKIHNELGAGHKESLYQKALAIILKEQKISFIQEVNIPIKFRNQEVGNYRPDFIVEDKVILETKAVDFMPKQYEVQLVRYLNGSNFKIGLLINFGTAKVQIKRRIAT
ncbi:GxxExxY protein [Candidatus Roizmanbacteria bacterium]|nr:GxxExxY protein [Candidatus Roizmanbacteria bacterium]